MGRKSREKRERREQRERQNETFSSTPIDTHLTNKSKEIIENESIDHQDQRIINILKVKDEDDAEVNLESLQRYFSFLKEEIELPCNVTGIEDMGCFGWEEYYNFGPGNKSEYNKLRMKRPSFRDKYKLLEFNHEIDEEHGIIVDVQRISDNKKFSLTLSDLKAIGKDVRNFQLIDDYAYWFENFR